MSNKPIYEHLHRKSEDFSFDFFRSDFLLTSGLTLNNFRSI